MYTLKYGFKKNICLSFFFPISSGWLVDRTGNYAATFFLSGASFIFSSAVLAAAMLVRHCQRSKLNSAAHLNPSHTAAAALQSIL